MCAAPLAPPPPSATPTFGRRAGSSANAAAVNERKRHVRISREARLITEGRLTKRTGTPYS